ncbi:L-lactate permease [Falsarthrobacter nasiphocae]|uniref:L-lactate permease n=1 Tax=Falsarthrobacter nasiphocae TaxID=189863 RepID=A0AAE3YGD0_9MICC|nr:L-lactate permease [Falsarthrobacter nasiphocae]MDR6892277.1 lactate permease [Falsarthrobacter nasiphocae]
MTTFTPHTDALGGSVALTALVAFIPLVAFFILLAIVKLKAHVAGLISLAVALAVAVVVMKMPVGLALLSASQGAVFGAFPVFWIVVMAVWLYQVTVLSGRFEDLRRIFDSIGGGDIRIQAVLIAFCFGGLLEALAGFGAPVAITATMLMALGLKPLKAATSVLLANTAPVAFGAIAIPITTAGKLTDLPADHIGAIVGRQAPLLAIVVPLILLFIIDGRRGVKDAWAPALVTGGAFALAQFLCANYFSYELTDIVASLAGLGAAVLFLKVWRSPARDAQAQAARERLGIAPVEAGSREDALTGSRTVMALMPYLLVIILFGVAKLWTLGVNVPKALASTDVKIPWPGLDGHLMTTSGKVSTSTVYAFQWLSNPGTLLLITGVLVAIIYSVRSEGGRYSLSVPNALAEIGRTLWRMRFAGLTIVSVLALAYVMNFSGQTIAIGTWLAATGGFFAFLSPILGWIGTAVTGSDTSANALFAKLQQTAATQAGIDPNLLVAANTTGGVVGKLISPQNLAIAATSVGMEGKESEILKTVIGWSVGMLFFLCCLVYLQSTPVLGWMLP